MDAVLRSKLPDQDAGRALAVEARLQLAELNPASAREVLEDARRLAPTSELVAKVRAKLEKFSPQPPAAVEKEGPQPSVPRVAEVQEDAALLAEMARARGEDAAEELAPVPGRGLWHATSLDPAFIEACRKPVPHEPLAPILMLDAASAAGNQILDFTASAKRALQLELRLACATGRVEGADWKIDVVAQEVDISGKAAASSVGADGLAAYRFEGRVTYVVLIVGEGSTTEVKGEVALGSALESGIPPDAKPFCERLRTSFGAGEKAKVPKECMSAVNAARGRFEKSLEHFAQRAETLLRRHLAAQKKVS